MKISIITVNYNDAPGLEKTLASETALRLPAGVETEVVVIDGGSTDGSVDVLKSFSGKIAYSVSERDRGIFHAMNKGVAAATGDFCIFMNSGDRFASEDVFEKIFAETGTRKRFEADVVTGSTIYVDSVAGTREFGRAPAAVSLGFFYNKTLQHQSSFIRTEKLRRFPYDETLKIVGDIKFWIQCLILDGGRYARTRVPVAEFDLAGVRSRPEGAEETELRRVFRDLKLEKILCDYDLIMHPADLKMRLCKHFFSRALRKELDI